MNGYFNEFFSVYVIVLIFLKFICRARKRKRRLLTRWSHSEMVGISKREKSTIIEVRQGVKEARRQTATSKKQQKCAEIYEVGGWDGGVEQ